MDIMRAAGRITLIRPWTKSSFVWDLSLHQLSRGKEKEGFGGRRKKRKNIHTVPP
jgi:hypothetical protein